MSQPVRVDENGMICKQIIVKGIVQKVGYRDAAFQEAKRMGGLLGWVRNLDNGDVEILVQGEPKKVVDFESWCHKGPPTARVDVVDARQVQTEPGLRSFGIRRL